MKTTCYMAMTLNGYAATTQDEVPWCQDIWNSYYNTAKKYKTIIIGRKTYDVMKDVNEFEKINNPFTIVLSKKKQAATKNTIFVTTPEEAIKTLELKGYKEALIAGGMTVNTSFLQAGLINELLLDIEPQLFGTGKPLFLQEEYQFNLELLKVEKISNKVIQVHYKIK